MDQKKLVNFLSRSAKKQSPVSTVQLAKMPSTVLSVKGMTCSACSNSITTQLQSDEAISKATVSLITEEAIVEHSNQIKPEAIKELIEDCGFNAEVISTEDSIDAVGADSKHLSLTRIRVGGMTCSNCTNSITNVVKPAVSKFEISLITEEAVIEHDPSAISTDQLVEMIEDCGFDATLLDSNPITQSKMSAVNGNEMVETIISVKGMTCGACTSSVQNVLNDIQDVVDSSVSLITEQAIVKHYKSLDPIILKDSIEDCGFDADIVETIEKTQALIDTTNFNIDRFSNVDEIESFKGVQSINLINDSTVAITYDSRITGVRTLIQSLNEIGIVGEPQNLIDTNSQIHSLNKLEEIQFWKSNFIKTSVIGIPMFAFTHILPLFDIEPSLHLWHGVYLESLIELVLSAYIQFTTGKIFYRNSIKSLKHGSGTMDLLIFISTNISFYFSIATMVMCVIKQSPMAPHTLFETAVLLMNFVSLGKWLESKAKSETSSSLSKLISLTSSECSIIEDPESFTVKNPGSSIVIPINYLQINDIVDIKPGEKIPADGVIIHGESEVDESLLTGESLPIYKSVNDKIFGGSINGVGHLYIRVLTTSENSQLSKIIKLVKLAQMNKAPIQSYADFVAGIFVPTILILAVLTFICWIIICNVVPNPPDIFNNINGKLFTCLTISISVIVVACPCALGLAAPTAIMVGTGVGAQHGVLIKGGEALQSANDIDVVLFDKTGTLTVGEMIVSDLHVFRDFDRHLLLKLIGSLECKSEHPIGQAIAKFSLNEVESLETNLEHFEVQIGKGLVGTLHIGDVAYNVKIGNLKTFGEDLLNNDEVFQSIKIDSEFTLAHIAINNQYIGFLELQDVIKPDARKVISYFKSKGYEVVMVTGDAQKAANRIASQVGIPLRNVYAEISPYGKEQLVVDFQTQGLKIAFVGDGINDSPALAKANLGIAIASGTDIAIEAADVVLLNEKPTLSIVVNALEISRSTLKRIKWNFFWSSVYNITMVPIAMGVLIPWGIQLSPLVAGLAMAFSSVSVVLSSLWLRRWTPPNLDPYDGESFEDDFDIESGRKTKKWKLSKSIKEMLKWKKQKKQDIGDDVELETGLLSSQ